MANPVIETYTNGIIRYDNTNQYTIPLAASANSGDLYLVCLSYGRAGASIEVDNTSTRGWTYVGTPYEWIPDDYNVGLTILYARAIGGGNDSLVVNVTLREGYNRYTGTTYVRYSNISYVTYRISNVLWSTTNPYKLIYDSSHNYGTSTSLSLSQCPVRDDNDIRDYLWIAVSATQDNNIASLPPSSFTLSVYQQGSTDYISDSSINTAYRSTTTISSISGTSFTAADSGQYLTKMIRIAPGDGSTSETIIPDATGGVLIPIRDKNAFINITNDVIATHKYSQNFSYNKTACTSPMTEVVSSGPWTCSWLGGTNFDADVYSGVSGDWVTISCKDVNSTASPYTDTLRFVCGTAQCDLVVTQYENGVGCS